MFFNHSPNLLVVVFALSLSLLPSLRNSAAFISFPQYYTTFFTFSNLGEDKMPNQLSFHHIFQADLAMFATSRMRISHIESR